MNLMLVLVCGFLAIHVSSFAAWAQSPRPTTVTVTAFLSQQASWERLKTFPARDQVLIKMTETCTYKVAEWTDLAIYLDPPNCTTSVSVDGRGVAEAVDFVPRREWTYSYDKPTEPRTTLSLDVETGQGEVTVGSVTLTPKPIVPPGMRSKGSAEPAGGGLALLVLEMLKVGSAGVEQPGVQFTGGPTVYELQRFKFPPKAAQFSGGNNGHYSLKFQDQDGAVATGTMSIDYTVSWGK
jgi:hypothetical protein